MQEPPPIYPLHATPANLPLIAELMSKNGAVLSPLCDEDAKRQLLVISFIFSLRDDDGN